MSAVLEDSEESSTVFEAREARSLLCFCVEHFNVGTEFNQISQRDRSVIFGSSDCFKMFMKIGDH